LKIVKIVFFVVISLWFIGCGYKPTALYARKSLSGKTYVAVPIDINNAKNSVLIKDALVELLIGKFNVQITHDKTKANAFVYGKLKSVSQTQLQLDTQGYAKVYRETVTVEVKYYKLGESPKVITLSNYYDFTINQDSSVTQATKDEAIKIAINKALTDIFSKIAIHSV